MHALRRAVAAPRISCHKASAPSSSRITLAVGQPTTFSQRQIFTTGLRLNPERQAKLHLLAEKLPAWSDSTKLHALTENALESGALDVVALVLTRAPQTVLDEGNVAEAVLNIAAQSGSDAVRDAVFSHPRLPALTDLLASPVRERILVTFIECAPRDVRRLIAHPFSFKPAVPVTPASSKEPPPLTPALVAAIRTCGQSQCSPTSLDALTALLQVLLADERFDIAELFPVLSAAAVRPNMLPLVRTLLDADAPPCYRRTAGAKDTGNPRFATAIPPFIVACGAGRLELLAPLYDSMMRHGASDDIERMLASGLVAAAHSGHLDVIKRLCDDFLPQPELVATLRGIMPGGAQCTALQAAAASGWMPVVEHLLGSDGQSGIAASGVLLRDKDGGSALELAIRGGRVNVAKFLLDKANVSPTDPLSESSGVTPLHVAARANQVDMLHHLLAEKRVDPSAAANDGLRAFDHAVMAGSLEVVRYFCETRLVPVESPVDEKRMTPLHLACESGQDLIALFLATETEANFTHTTSDGVTAIHRACAFCSPKIVSFIHRERQVDFNAFRADDGTTPFFWACQAGNLAVVKYLHQRASIDCTIANNDGLTPFLAAGKANHTAVVKYLHEEAGIAGTMFGG